MLTNKGIQIILMK